MYVCKDREFTSCLLYRGAVVQSIEFTKTLVITVGIHIATCKARVRLIRDISKANNLVRMSTYFYLPTLWYSHAQSNMYMDVEQLWIYICIDSYIHYMHCMYSYLCICLHCCIDGYLYCVLAQCQFTFSLFFSFLFFL